MRFALTLGVCLLLAACVPPSALPTPTQSASPTIPVTLTSIPPSPTSTLAPTPTSRTSGSFPDPGNFTWQERVVGIASPVDLANAGDGSDRLFVVEQTGAIWIVQEGQVLLTPFLDIRDRVGSQSNEQGLLGLAFHPRYAENGYFYVNYTGLNGDTVIARFRVSDDPNLADPGSERQLLTVDQPFPNHNGGGVVFGPDGYLYLSLGDGGSGGDPLGNGQSLDTLLGKLLRIGVDGGEPYAIPPDNPFAGGGGLPEIWAYGLRNPWRFAFDALTHDLYIADVGQSLWEEVNFLPSGTPGGSNFGWNYLEGMHPYQGVAPAGLALSFPIAEYDHSGGRCSVTGGHVYRGQAMPEWQGVYFYADYCSGEVWGLLRSPDGAWQNELLFTLPGRPTAFGLDEAGELYVVLRKAGVYQLIRK